MTGITRRDMVVGGALATLAAPLAAQVAAGDEAVPLWPGPPPGSPAVLPVLKVTDRPRNGGPDRRLTGVGKPQLIVRRAQRPNGSAVLLIPGGSYALEAYDNEGTEQAAWLNAEGVTAFILNYRLPGEGWAGRADAPLADAQRAVRLIRAGAARFGIAANRVAVLGFSAGGHLAGSLTTRAGEAVYAPVDATDSLSARPDLAGLVYPVITLDQPFAHAGSRDNLLGKDAPVAEAQRRSVERNVGPDTPPVMLIHAADDKTVPVANSIAMFTAMQAASRPVEMHLFEEGGHGFGVRQPADRPVAAWPRLFSAFARRHGVFAA